MLDSEHHRMGGKMRYIVYATDDNYAMMAAVSMYSLLVNNSSKTEYTFFILTEGLSSENKKRLTSICKMQEAHIHFLGADVILKELVKKFEIPAWNNGSYGTYSRLFIGALLPDYVDDVLYLDCDTLILDDLKPLFDYRFEEGKALIGVKDIVGNSDYAHRREIGISDTASYFNAGVCRINVNYFRENECNERILNHMRDVRSVYPFVDQDIFNVVMENEIQIVSPKWNYWSTFKPFHTKQLYFMYGVKEDEFYNQKYFEEECKNPVIIHFINIIFSRPWFLNSNNPLKNEWVKYKECTPYKGVSLKKTKRSLTYHFMDFSYELLSVDLFSILYKYARRIG